MDKKCSISDSKKDRNLDKIDPTMDKNLSEFGWKFIPIWKSIQTWIKTYPKLNKNLSKCV